MFAILPVRLLILLSAAVCLASSKRKWLSSNWREECGSEYSGLQSKLLVSPIVVKVKWAAAWKPSSRFYNQTVTIKRVFKAPTHLRPRLKGRVVSVGTFDRDVDSLDRQRERCLPGQLKSRHQGYVFFLRTASDRRHFQHVFLPVPFTKNARRRLEGVACKRRRKCPQPPRIAQSVRHRLAKNSRRKRKILRITCRAKGKPRPLVYWYKDGRRIELNRKSVAKYRVRSGTMFAKLDLVSPTLSVAGNYTCRFVNPVGWVASSKLITLESAFVATTTQKPTTSSSASMTSSMRCDFNNFTYCLNGGTCVIHRLTQERHCLCPPGFNGVICETVDLPFLQNYVALLKRANLAKSLASAGSSSSQASLPTAALALLLTIFALMLVFACVMLVSIYRRLVKQDKQQAEGVSGLSLPNQSPPPPPSILLRRARSPTRKPPTAEAATFTDIHQHSPAFTDIHQHSPAFTDTRRHLPAPASRAPARLHRNGPATLPANLSANSNLKQQQQQQQQHTIRPIFNYGESEGGEEGERLAEALAEIGMGEEGRKEGREAGKPWPFPGHGTPARSGV